MYSQRLTIKDLNAVCRLSFLIIYNINCLVNSLLFIVKRCNSPQANIPSCMFTILAKDSQQQFYHTICNCLLSNSLRSTFFVQIFTTLPPCIAQLGPQQLRLPWKRATNQLEYQLPHKHKICSLLENTLKSLEIIKKNICSI